jgi:hypothetical protein
MLLNTSIHFCGGCSVRIRSQISSRNSLVLYGNMVNYVPDIVKWREGSGRDVDRLPKLLRRPVGEDRHRRTAHQVKIERVLRLTDGDRAAA